MSAAGSVPDTDNSLGNFTQAELLFMRQQQELITQQSQTASQRSATMPDRGRGTSRHSQPSSRDASRASSNNSVPGRIPLDSPSLARLYSHLDNLIRSIQIRMDYIENETDAQVEVSRARGRIIEAASDRALAKLRKLDAELDHLDARCREICQIRDKVSSLKERVDAAGGRMEAVRSRPVARPDTRRR